MGKMCDTRHFLSLSSSCFYLETKSNTLLGFQAGYTANVYRGLQDQSAGNSNLWGLPVTHNPCNFEIPTLCNICRGFDFTGILWGYPTLVLGKSCNDYGETM